MFPDIKLLVISNVTVVVPCPEIIVAPVGAVQV
jgi:hypothetical protein